MKKTKRGIAVLLISLLFSMNIVSVFATDSSVVSEPKVYTEGEETLNLEGNFTADGNDGAIWVKDGAQLTINGTDETEVHGTLGADNYSMAVYAQADGTKVVINGGYYTNETDGSTRGTDLIYASNGAEIEINGGKFKAAKTEWTLNCKDKKNTAEKVVLPSTITVKGGTFYKFDPSNTTVGEGEVVVPEGYGVVKNGDWYTVVETVYAKGTNTLNLEGQLTANGSNGAIWVKDGAQLTINGTDETEVHGTLGADNYSMAVWAKDENAKVIINGGYYTNETDGSTRGTDLIYASNGAEIEINGGKFKAAKTEWTLNCKDKKNTTKEVVLPSTITVKGGTFYNFDPSNTTVGEGEVVVPDGYRVVKNGEWYTVYKENTITVQDAENGTISSTLAKAIVGETVGLTIKANEGYEIGNVIVTDANGKAVTVTNNEFVMPDSAVTVKVEFNQLTQDVEIPDMIEDAEKVENILLESLKEDEKFAEAIKNNNLEVKVEVTENKVDEDRKEEIEEAIKEKDGVTVSKYFDITIAVKNKDNNETIGTLDELKETIKFSIAIPEDLPEVAEGFERKFYIIRNHNGVIEYLDAILSEDGKILNFETDKFSAYALAYADVETTNNDIIEDEDASGDTSDGATGGSSKPVEQPKEETKEEVKEEEKTDVPNTGDNIVLFVVLAVIAIAGIVISKKINTKK